MHRDPGRVLGVGRQRKGIEEAIFLISYRQHSRWQMMNRELYSEKKDQRSILPRSRVMSKWEALSCCIQRPALKWMT